MPDAPDLPLLSATQISLWSKECKRKWAFRYVEGIKEPKNEGQLLGTETQDKQLDPYLGEGRAFDFSPAMAKSAEIANKLVPLLPRPNPELRAAGIPELRLRRKFLLPSPTGKFGYQGEFDMSSADSGCVPGLSLELDSYGLSPAPLLGDIKIIKNLDFAQTKVTLAKDIQSQLYAADMMFYDEGCDELDLVWFYSRSRGALRAQRVHVRVKAPHVLEQFQSIDAIGLEVAAAWIAQPKPNDLEPNPKWCDKMGGCPYRGVCNLSPAVHAASVNEEAKQMSNSFLTQLRANVGAPPPAAAPPPAPAAPAAPPAPVPAPSALPAWATAPVDPRAAQAAAPRQWVMPAPEAPKSAAPVAAPTGAAVPMAAAVNPPESALPPAPPVGAAAPAAEAPKKRGRPPKSTAAVTAALAHVSGVVPVTEPMAVLGGGPAPVMLAELPDLVALCRQHGVKRIALNEGKVYEVELFPVAPGA